ncbi:MAG: hypothetical protein A2Z99_03695 [Treponema sp. GWB1_62_6]|nr:MAG: hypothetical protein A2Y36_13225 [Treponema sp. GWA1_62_8]OHE62632.1 MAG: hypothetical protein A2Z99_03695 [Treponema sp. GWB1_62_6]OHE65726.1 MAG: hypothetical protein A2001_15020 [Treponema sp. GWC1_61_84]HCM26013.1 hypothetical protein [Treponema sp.]
MRLNRIIAIIATMAFVSVAETGFAQNGHEGKYLVTDVSWSIEGRTQEAVLVEKSRIKEGLRFPDEEKLAAFLENREQALINERVLAEVRIEYSLGEPAANGDIPVAVSASIRDTWNIFVLPYFKYDSNDGFLLSLRGRDYNFFGTMEPLRVNLDYTLDENQRSEISLDASFEIPFSFKKKEMIWGLSQGFTVPADDAIDPTYEAKSFLELNLPIAGFNSVGRLTQGFRTNVRGEDGEVDENWVFDTEVQIGNNWPIGDAVEPPQWGPFAFWSATWRPDKVVDPDQRALNLGGGQSISGGRFDWIGNQRQGFTWQSEERLYYAFLENEWKHELSASAAVFSYIWVFGASSRLKGFWDINGTSTSAGSALRGVLDKRLDAEAAITLNLDAPVSLVFFEPSKWFGASWMRFFEFEGQASPFFDMALSKRSGASFDLKEDFWYSGGLELIGYPYVARSFYVRISAGLDLRDRSEPMELFFGLGHHY